MAGRREDAGTWELRLPAGPVAAGVAREWLRGLLRDVGTQVPTLSAEQAQTVVLLSSELVTNAVLHAGAATGIRVRAADGLTVEVSDPSPALPLARTADEDSLGGRGLELVELLADGYGVRVGVDGKAVWFTVAAGQPLPRRWQIATDEPHPPVARPIARIRLLDTPTRLYRALARYNEALLRDFLMLHVNQAGGSELTAEIAAADAVRSRIGREVIEGIDAAGGVPPAALDMEFDVSAEDVEALRRLRGIYADAEVAAQAGHLVVGPVLPELDAVRQWWVAEVLAQAAGRAATPWTPPLLPRMPVPEGRLLALPADVRHGLDDGATIVVDVAHTLVFASDQACDLLGRTDLVGRRMSVIVPERVREQHLASFATATASGNPDAVRQPLTVPVLGGDGREFGAVAVLERVLGTDLYLGRIVAGGGA